MFFHFWASPIAQTSPLPPAQVQVPKFRSHVIFYGLVKQIPWSGPGNALSRLV